MTEARITLLPGDGIGPEVVDAAARVLQQVGASRGHRFGFQEAKIGGAAVDAVGDALPTATLLACEAGDAILLGAVGGPAWADREGRASPEQGLLRLRSHLGLFANLRPVPVFPPLVSASPLRPEILAGVDLLVVRELTGGIYFGPRREAADQNEAVDTMIYSFGEVERIAHVAFRAARRRRRKVTSVDKANVLATSRLWRRVVMRVAQEYQDVELEHLYVDACAMQLLRSPSDFDVVLTGNLFGDILSDEASMLAGSLGVLPSASLGEGTLGVYEPVHGSAPELAGKGVANPLGAILSGAMLLRHSLGLEGEAQAIETAVARTLVAGLATPDLVIGEGPPLTTGQLTAAILDRLD